MARPPCTTLALALLELPSEPASSPAPNDLPRKATRLLPTHRNCRSTGSK